ncbi:ImmA/IrrE family metallo-endopeptidase [Neorhizobium galegae]|uniref:ImmA/IrrE family metallo-endopeptidase n=1 Tax=Neorhizobium galegae TaxID=399 RepID=UPI002100780E|nr:ImmA/IrrE family metallo-endopeptidase [Neorhizobium galegae]MCQ1572726.1 ImmA/IrrE family metallo-endopeptidase [Neorhizobium galegae]
MKTTTMPRIDPLPKNLGPDALLRSLGITEPRDIDVEAIAFYVGLRVKRRCLKCCEAMITGCGNKGIISVMPGGMLQRERFSIAHELGHWAHHRGETIACRSSDIGKFSNKNDAERAADAYAANLLMPLPMFKAECRQHQRLDLKALKAVAGAFNTSMTATLIRMIDTGNYPTSIMISHGTGGRRWFKLASGIPGYWKPKDDLDADSFALKLLFDPTSREEAFPRKIGGDAWFDNWEAGKFQITEQSFRVPGEGVITILNLDSGMIR